MELEKIRAQREKVFEASQVCETLIVICFYLVYKSHQKKLRVENARNYFQNIRFSDELFCR